MTPTVHLEESYHAITMISFNLLEIFFYHLVAAEYGRFLLVACRETADLFRSVLLLPGKFTLLPGTINGHGSCRAAKGLTSTLYILLCLGYIFALCARRFITFTF